MHSLESNPCYYHCLCHTVLFELQEQLKCTDNIFVLLMDSTDPHRILAQKLRILDLALLLNVNKLKVLKKFKETAIWINVQLRGKKISYPSHVFLLTMNSTKEIHSTVHLYHKYSETSIKFNTEMLFCPMLFFTLHTQNSLHIVFCRRK